MAVAVPPPSARTMAAPAGARGTAAGRRLIAALLAVSLLAAFAGGAVKAGDEAPVQLLVAALAIVGAGAWALGLLRSPRGAAPWIGPALLLGFAAWSGASLAWSVAPAETWAELNRALAYALVAGLAVLGGASGPGAVRWAARGVLVVTLAVAAYALLGKLWPALHVGDLVDLRDDGATGRLREPLEYWNALALVCALGVPVAVRLAAGAAVSRHGRVGSVAAAVVLLVAVGLSYSRGGVLAVLVGVGVAVVLAPGRLRALAAFALAAAGAVPVVAYVYATPALANLGVPLGERIVAGRSLALVLAAGIAVAAAGALALERVPWERLRLSLRLRAVAVALAVVALGVLGGLAVDRVRDDAAALQGAQSVLAPQRLISATDSNRLTWWKEAAGAWADRPLTGWGAGSFPVTHLRYRKDPLNVRQPHSVPLELLAETGAVGLLLGFGGVVALVAVAAASLRRLRGSERDLGAALAAVGAAWLAHSLLDWDWDIPATLLPVLVVTGALAGRGWARADAGGRLGIGWLAPVALAVCAVAASALLPAWSDALTEGAYERARGTAPSGEALADAVADARLAARLNPLAVEPLFAVYALESRRRRVREARDALLDAVRRNPNDAGAWRRLANASLLLADVRTARRASRRVLVLDPLGPRARELAAAAIALAAPPSESPTASGTPLAP